MEYVQKLMQDGTWEKLSGDAHSILLYIIAKSKNQPIKLTYSQVSKDLGISVNTAKKYIKILIEEKLIIHDPESGTYKPTQEINNTNSGLPLPPGQDVEDPKEDTDLLEWAQDFMSSGWGALFGGAVIGYIIRLWLEYLEQQNNDPFANFPTFASQNRFPNLHLEEVNAWLKKSHP